jgi:hypothetical protein
MSPQNFVQMDPSLKVAQCPCKSQNYNIILEPILRNGTAALKELVCSNCGLVVAFSGDAILGDKDKVQVDQSGRKHYHLDVNTGGFGPL